MSHHVYSLGYPPKDLEDIAATLIARHPLLCAVPDGVEALTFQPAEKVLTAALSWKPPTSGSPQTPDDLPKGSPFGLALLPQQDKTVHLHVLLRLYAFDAHAMSIFYADLSDLLTGRKLPPAPAPALAMRLHPIDQAEVARAEEFWIARLDSLPPAPDLLQSLPATGPTRFIRHRRVLGAPLWQVLRSALPRYGLTASALLAAVYLECLSRLANTRALSLAMLVSRRGQDDTDVLGNFGTTLLLAVDLTGPTFRCRAQAVQTALLEAVQQSAFSAIALARRIGGAHGPQNVPFVFSSGLGSAPERGAGPRLDGPGIQQVSACLSTPQVLIDHQVHEEHGALILDFDIVEAAFLPGLPERLAEMVLSLLQRLATRPAIWGQTGDIAMLPAETRARACYNATGTPFLPGPGGLVAHLANRSGDDGLALADSDREMTGAALERESAALAATLKARGLSSSDLVAVMARRGWRQVVAVLAIARAGAAYLPIAPDWPAARVRQLLQNSRARALLCDPDSQRAIAHIDTDLPVLDVSQTLLSAPLPACAKAGLDQAQPQDLAYVIYTSGSTGTPKGVAVSHGAAANTIADIRTRWGLGPGDRVLGISGLHFDLSVFDIFGFAAWTGGLILPPPSALPDPSEWRLLIETRHVTVWNSVPALFEVFVDHLGADAAAVLGRLKLVMLSGDWVPPALVARVKALSPNTRLIALGGATEAAIWSIAHEINENGALPGWTSVPYGSPLRAQGIDILDNRLAPLPDGAAGEIHIYGAGLAEGYHRDTARTDEAFVTHPDTGVRYYRSGDIGRFRDGVVEFMGRRDGQVKLRGNRIELGEIEAALEAQPGIRRAACMVLSPKGGSQMLVAAAVGTGMPEPRLKALAALLPSAMVPQHLALVSELPLTANGKLDRKALLHYLSNQFCAIRPSKGYRSLPTTKEAKDLAALWQQVGAHEPRDGSDDFFEVGGNSLAALRLCNLVNSRFGTSLTPAQLFRDSQFAAQLGRLTGQDPASIAQDAPALRRLRDGALPLCLIHPVGGSTACYAPLVSALVGDLDVQTLEAGEGPGIGADFEALVTEYAALLTASIPGDKQIVLGGWSMGATLALSLAVQPIMRSRVQGLVLIDPYGPDPLIPVPKDRLAAFFQDLLGVDLLLEDLDNLPQDTADRVTAISDRLCRRGLLAPDFQGSGLTKAFDRYARLARALGTRHAPDLASLTCPTLVIEADTDLITPGLIRLPLPQGATLSRCAGTHHTIVLGNQGTTTAQQISSFLKTLNPTDNRKGRLHVKENH
jgi:amino acid adenylation domain-containing protein